MAQNPKLGWCLIDLIQGLSYPGWGQHWTRFLQTAAVCVRLKDCLHFPCVIVLLRS